MREPEDVRGEESDTLGSLPVSGRFLFLDQLQGYCTKGAN